MYSSCLDVACVTSARIPLVKAGALAAKPNDRRVVGWGRESGAQIPGTKHAKVLQSLQ